MYLIFQVCRKTFKTLDDWLIKTNSSLIGTFIFIRKGIVRSFHQKNRKKRFSMIAIQQA